MKLSHQRVKSTFLESTLPKKKQTDRTRIKLFLQSAYNSALDILSVTPITPLNNSSETLQYSLF